jgi:hypothetical protein
MELQETINVDAIRQHPINSHVFFIVQISVLYYKTQVNPVLKEKMKNIFVEVLENWKRAVYLQKNYHLTPN